MFTNEAELWLFIDWLLLGVAKRPEAGKNPTQPISGPWVLYNQLDQKKRGKSGVRKGQAYLRGSDLPMRRYLAIAAMREHGFSHDAACAELGIRLGKTTAPEMASISRSYHKYQHPFKEQITRTRSQLVWPLDGIGYQIQYSC